MNKGMIKNIVIFLVGTVIVAGSLFFFMQNQTKIKSLNTELTKNKKYYNELEEKNKNKAETEKKLSEIDVQKKFYEKKLPGNILQEDNIVDIRQFEANSGCKIISINYKNLQYDAEHVIVATPDPNKKSGSSPTPAPAVGGLVPGAGMVLPVTIRFEGTYDQMRALIKQIEQSEVKAIIKTITTSKAVNTDIISGNMELGFYGIKAPEPTVSPSPSPASAS